MVEKKTSLAIEMHRGDVCFGNGQRQDAVAQCGKVTLRMVQKRVTESEAAQVRADTELSQVSHSTRNTGAEQDRGKGVGAAIAQNPRG